MSWMGEAWKVFRQTGRAIDYRDVASRTGMSDHVAQNCICRLLASGCIRFVRGSARKGRYYEAVPGVAPPADQRGRHPNSKEALARTKRIKASRPVSQITAARLKS